MVKSVSIFPWKPIHWSSSSWIAGDAGAFCMDNLRITFYRTVTCNILQHLEQHLGVQRVFSSSFNPSEAVFHVFGDCLPVLQHRNRSKLPALQRPDSTTLHGPLMGILPKKWGYIPIINWKKNAVELFSKVTTEFGYRLLYNQ